MRIIINIEHINTVLTGIGRVTLNLIEALSKYKSIDLRYFDGKKVSTSISLRICSNIHIKLISYLWKLPSLFVYFLRKTRRFKQNISFNKTDVTYDIYYETGYFPFKTNKSSKVILTVHDMSLIDHPEWHPKERVMFFRNNWMKFYQYVDYFITPSEFTKNRLIKHYPPSRGKISVIHWAVDERIFFKKKEDEIAKVLNKFGINNKYFVCVGTNDPRKNLDGVIEAFLIVERKGLVNLVLIGWEGWGKSHTITENIIETGHVDDDDLVCLYSGALGIIYVSFYEGFGLPVLEGFACGVPVIASNNTSIPEVAGDGALLVDPYSVDEIAGAMTKIIEDEALRNELIQQGYEQLKKFSWEKCAKEHLDVYEKVLNYQSK